jgi:hypothetical protein
MMLPLLLLLSWMMTLSSVGAARYNHDHFLGAVSSSSSWLSSSSRHLPSTTLWGRSNYKTPSSKSNRIVQTKNVVGRYNNNVLLSTMMQLRAGDVADHAVVVAEEQQEKDQEELPHLDQNATFANTTKDVVTNESSSVSTTTTTATTTTTTTTTTPSNDNNPLLFGDPVSVTVQTLLNSPLLDQSVELTMARSRNLASLKKSVSRSLPGRPPESLLYFRYQGRLLQDDQMLIDELMNEKEENDEEDEDDEEKESSGSTLTLQLDMIPPVDPKFAATQLSLQLPQMTTSELLDAYTTNAAAMYRHAQSILRENDVDELVTTASSTSLSVQLQQQARLLRQDLEATFSEKALQLLTPSSSLQQPTEEGGGGGGDETKGEPITDAHTGTIQQRGQRIRVLGGSKANFKSIVQRNLNLVRTLKSCCTGRNETLVVLLLQHVVTLMCVNVSSPLYILLYRIGQTRYGTCVCFYSLASLVVGVCGANICYYWEHPWRWCYKLDRSNISSNKSSMPWSIRRVFCLVYCQHHNRPF